MLTEIEYRTFDELLDSVRIDLKTIDLENNIEPQELIKIATRVSWELGLKINPSRSKTIEITKGKGKLPADFYVLNFALLCMDKKDLKIPGGRFPISYKTYCQGVIDGQEMAADLNNAVGNKFTVMDLLYTETLDIEPGNNVITHDLGTQDFVVQAVDTTGAFLDFNLDPGLQTDDQIVIVSQAGVTITDVKVTIHAGNTADWINALKNDINPCNDGTVQEPCSNSTVCTELTDCNGNPVVSCTNQTNTVNHQYHHLVPLKIEKSKTLSPDSFNLMTLSRVTGQLKNGFLVTNFDEGTVYLNYQSLMEDDEGQLLVMSHPIIDEFYEYAIKQRVYENLVMSGNATATGPLQLIEARYRTARTNALSYVNTPDFGEMRKVWELNRTAQYSNYYDMFKSYGIRSTDHRNYLKSY